jgi:hypothetical protein
MEILVLVILLVAVGLLALRFGYDSRESAYSKEADLAQLGISCSDATPALTKVDEREPQPEGGRPRLVRTASSASRAQLAPRRSDQ